MKRWLHRVWSHRTKIAGVLGMIAGYVQNNLAQIDIYLPDRWRGLIVFCFGLAVFLIGVYNSSQLPPPPP